MSFAINLFRRPLRFLLDDWDMSVPYRYPDMVLDDAVRTMVSLGKLNCSVYSSSVGYTLSPDQNGIDPDWSQNPQGYNLFALGTYHTTLLFLGPMPEKYALRTRGISETRGSLYRHVEKMEAEIHRLENGEGLFSGYQSYYSWICGISGLPVGEILARFDVESPLWTATFTRDGMRVA